MKRRLFTIIVCLILGMITQAQPNIQIEWQRTIGGSDWDFLYALQQTPDGGYIMGGSSSSGASGEKTDTCRGGYDYYVIKTNDTGGIVWQRTYGGSSNDVLKSLSLTNDGGYILGGSSSSGISGEKTDTNRKYSDYWIIKIDDTGTIEWQKTIGGTHLDEFSKIIQTNDGGYMAGGFSRSGISGEKTDSNRKFFDYWVLKLDSLGSIEWQKTIGGSGSDYLYDLMQTPDGGYLLGGNSSSGISGEKTDTTRGGNDYWIVKLNAFGQIEWDKTIGGINPTSGGGDHEIFSSLTLTSDNGYLLAGRSKSGISGEKTDSCRGDFDYWIVKIDSLGSVQWDKTFGGSGWDDPSTIISTADGGFMVHGWSRSAMSGEKAEIGWGMDDYWVLKCSDIGNIQWQKTYGGMYVDNNSRGSLLETSDGYVLGGQSMSGVFGDKTDTCRGQHDFWIVKLLEDCPDTTLINAGEICSSEGYNLPWGQTVYSSGDYTQVYPPAIEGSQCDSIVTITLTINQIIPATISVDDNFTLTTAVPYETYQWCLEGIPISGAMQSSYTVTENGDYTVIVTDSMDCKDTSDVYSINNVGININDILAAQIHIYPNPTNTMVTIDLTSSLRLQAIRIINLLGAEVYSAIGNKQSKQTLDISRLANGVYMLQIQTDKGKVIRKLEVLR